MYNKREPSRPKTPAVGEYNLRKDEDFKKPAQKYF